MEKNNENKGNLVDLHNLNEGVLVDLFQQGLLQCLANIKDERTPSNRPREIKLIIKIEPSEIRDMALVEAKLEVKLVPVLPSVGFIKLAYEEERLRAYIG